MTPQEFITKWSASELKERSAAQEHFIDLCRLLGEQTPAEADPTGNDYCFERGARKDSGGAGWADVWKRHHFAWEYKRKHASLDAAFNQLRQYVIGLENPPLLIVSDMNQFRICTNWTNTVSEIHVIELHDLVDGAIRKKLKWVMSDPDQLRPGETRQMVTEKAAAHFSSLARSLREQDHNPEDVAHFVNRLVFCMFAEDVDLLPDKLFTRMLERARKKPERFEDFARQLFAAMSTGGELGLEDVDWFNGGLFENDIALPLDVQQIETTLNASRLDWSSIDPSILGTLFERGLDPDKRSQLGTHYTDRDKIMRIIDPVIIRPWQAAWQAVKKLIVDSLSRATKAKSKSAATRHQNRAQKKLDEFLEKLHAFTVLDPACGSGNFLYLALQSLLDMEHRIQFEAESLGLQRHIPTVGVANVKGIELNTYAAELARVSVWIGEIQWMRRNGFPGSQEPILKPLETIECRDAILSSGEVEPDWPNADVIIGNPPFLGGKLLIKNLGEEYVARMFQVYEGRVPHEADLVCYWFVKAGERATQGHCKRVGLVATNSIRGGTNRQALERAIGTGMIFDAWSDEPWVIDGAAVRVSLVCFSKTQSDDAPKPHLDGDEVDEIHTDLTARKGDMGINLTKVRKLSRNVGAAFMGDTQSGPFLVSGELAREWLRQPVNPNGRPNSDVLKPWMNGRDITNRSADNWIIDFGFTMTEEDAALYERPFQYIREHVLPVWKLQRPKDRRKAWWLHHRPRPKMWSAIEGLSRYIATPSVAKYRLFTYLDTRVCPDHALIVIARQDDTTFGILHSRFHEVWSLRMGTSLTDRPRYTPTTTFQTFPFPEGLSPDISAIDYENNVHAQTIASAARYLVEVRDRWLNPPEWVEWIEEPVAGYPLRREPRDKTTEDLLKKRTLTNLYNEQPQWLINAHTELNIAVAAAYGWPSDITDEDVIRDLLAKNHQ